MQNFFWTSADAGRMARPAAPSPIGPRRVLSAGSLLKNASLEPIIASRSGGSNEPTETRLSQVRYLNDRSSYLTTPRNMYDYEDSSSSIFVPYTHRQHTRIHRLDDNYSVDRYVNGKALPPVFYSPSPRPRPRPHRQDDVRRRIWRRDYEYSVRTSGCYTFLKILELVSCAIDLLFY